MPTHFYSVTRSWYVLLMKIEYVLYDLVAHHSLNSISSSIKREGALLKVQFSLDLVGYADCFSWSELGDLPLKEQLKRLAKGQLTKISRCALELAYIDAQARSKNKSVFDHSFSIPKSHFLITDFLNSTLDKIQKITQQGYTHLKIKVGRDLIDEIKKLQELFLNTPLRLRLDFNESLTLTTFSHFLHQIANLQDRIDFIEDPFPFDSKEWESIQKEGWRLACDKQVERASQYPDSASILIVKPAVNSFEQWMTWKHQQKIVTTYLGHPLGQVAAAYISSLVDPQTCFVHGLLSHHVYEPTIFSRLLNWNDPRFLTTPGTGFGFDDLLEQEQWNSL